MPTINPRITITLKPEVHAVLKRLSALTENSQSAIVSELLESSLSVFERMVSLLETAKKIKAEGMQVPDEFLAGLEAAQGRLEGQLGLALGDIDAGCRPVLEVAEKVRRRAGRQAGDSLLAASSRPARAAPTPLSNRGVTPHQIGKNKGKTLAKPPTTKGVQSPRKGVKNGPV